MPLADIQICATTALIRVGRVTPISAPGKAVLAVQVAPPLFGPPGHEVLNFEITDLGDKRVITASYRHPYSAKSATKLADEVRKRCPL